MRVSDQVNNSKKLDELIELQKEANGLLEFIAEQEATNGEMLCQSVGKLNDIDKRQAKNDKLNFPMIFIGAVASYFAIHAMVFGAEDLKFSLIFGYDLIMGLFL